MASISLPFSSWDVFRGAGTAAGLTFYAMYPPELGCFGFGVGSPGITTTIAQVTNRAKALLARAVTDGTSIRVTHFAFGAGGYDPIDPLRPTIIDLDAVSLEQEIMRKTVDAYEVASVDGRTRSFAARLSRTELIGGIGEYALIATILSSPFPSEVGSTFPFAIGHQGLRAKGANHVETYRILVTI